MASTLYSFKLLTSRDALSEGITGQFGGTRTNRIVIDNYTLCSNAACSGAGIYAFPIITGHVGGTVRTDNTLSSTIGWCVQISRKTRTDSLFLYLSTLAVRSTRCRIARIFRYRFYVNIKKRTIKREREIERDIYNNPITKLISIIRNDRHVSILIARMDTFYRGAHYKGVAGHFRRASADWYVISDRAQGIETADSKIARISTLVLNASSVTRTIGIQNTFWTTSKVWIFLILGKARTHAVKALRIWATI